MFSRVTLPPCILVLSLAGCGQSDKSPTLGAVPASGPVAVAVVARDYGWTYRFAGSDGAMNTSDDLTSENELHLPCGREIELLVQSEDYVCTFDVPGSRPTMTLDTTSGPTRLTAGIGLRCAIDSTSNERRVTSRAPAAPRARRRIRDAGRA